MRAAAAVRCGAFGVEFGRATTSGPQLLVVEKVSSSRIGRVAIDSSQPLSVAERLTSSQVPQRPAGHSSRWWRSCPRAGSVAQRPAARNRPLAEGCSSTSQARPLGCGLAPSWDRSVRTERAEPPGGGGPPFVPELACAPQAAARTGIDAQTSSASLSSYPILRSTSRFQAS